MTRGNQTKIDPEHIKFLANIFQEVRTEGYMHDYDGDFKIIGTALKRAKEYNMVDLMEMMEYFKKYGIKEVKSMSGWLIWAFKNPKVAAQPFNTIDLQKGNNTQRGETNERKVAQPTGRDYYDDLFKQFDGTN